MNRIFAVVMLLSVVLLAGCQKEKFSVSRMNFGSGTLYVVHHKESSGGQDTLVFTVSYPEKYIDGRNMMSIIGAGYFHLDDLRVDYRKDGSKVVLNGQRYDLDNGKVLKVDREGGCLVVVQDNPTAEFLSHANVSPN